MMKGQISFELLVTVGVILAFTIPVLFLMLSMTSVGYEDTAKAQADAAARTLADTINSVYSQGPGAQRSLLLNVPATTENIAVINSEVVVKIRTGKGSFEAAAPTIGKMSPDLTKSNLGKKNGLFKIIVHTNDQGEVELSAS